MVFSIIHIMANCFILILKKIDTSKTVVDQRFVGVYEDTDLLEADYQRGLIAGALIDVEPPSDDTTGPQKLLGMIRSRRAGGGMFFPPLTTFYIEETGEAYGFNDVQLVEAPYMAAHQYLNSNR